MKFSWYLHYTSTLKLHGVSGDEPEEEEEEDLHEDEAEDPEPNELPM